MTADDVREAEKPREALEEQIRYWTGVGEGLKQVLARLDGTQAGPRRVHLRLVIEDEKGGDN